MEKIPIRHIKTSQKEPGFSGSFGIRDVGELLSGEDMVQELHRHDFFYILVVKKGTGNHDIDFTPYAVCDNTIFIMRPGQVHQLVLKAGSMGYLVQFNNDYYFPNDKAINQSLKKASSTNYYQFSSDSFKKVLYMLDYILQEYTYKQDRHHDVIKANMGMLFIELARQHKNITGNSANSYMQGRLEDFFALLDTHVFTQKQVSQYAAMLSISIYQLNAITKNLLGKTPSELIAERIVLEAKRYLLATPNQINKIADILGYEDVSYFIRVFKKHTGHSPDAFRHNLK